MPDLSHGQFHPATSVDHKPSAQSTRAYRAKRVAQGIRTHMETEHNTNTSVWSDSHVHEEHDRKHRAARLYGDTEGHAH